jgi:endonuclease YncB( thermonuclease family)
MLLWRPLSALLLSLGLGMPAQAARLWEGRVTHVSDGDTLWVQPLSGAAAQKLRLEGLDAPELCQRWGEEARAALQGLLRGQVVQVQSLNRDTYGRRLARIQWQGHDVGHWLVLQGHAWSSTFEGRAGRYAEAQQQAQAQRRGVFSQAGTPLTPRQFRQRYGACPLPQTGHAG